VSRPAALLGWALLIQSAFAGQAPRDYWMYIGAYTYLGSPGISVYKYHSTTGKVESGGLAAGSLWQSNRDALSGSLPRMVAQMRAEWPSMKMMARGVQNPSFLAVHPNGRFLYTADENPSGTVSAFRIDPATGKLTMLNSQPSNGNKPCFVTVDHTGRWLLATNFMSGSVVVLPIHSDGSLGPVTSLVQHSGSGTGNLGPHPHSVNLSPDNRFALAADLGLDEIRVYRFDQDRGILTPNDPPLVRTPANAGARHLSFHPNGNLAYVIEELGSSITAMRWDSEHGVPAPIETVSTLPKDSHVKSGAAEVLVRPDGRFLYASSRGPNIVTVFRIDAVTGQLTPIQYISTQGKQPRNFRIDPTGNYLFAGNVETNNVVQFHIDRQSGFLKPTGLAFQVVGPTCIKFAPAQ